MHRAAGCARNDTASPQWADSRPGVFEERLFQAARFVTEMEYQHLVFEEFGRKIQPAIKPFHVSPSPPPTSIRPSRRVRPRRLPASATRC